MGNLPRITIVMPSYNQSQFIEESIQSILDQNYPNLEFMILDGDSTDGSQEIIQRYASYLAFWQSGPDKGQTDALIQGFERATGDLLGWVNSDDVLLPGALQSTAQAYGSNPDYGLFGGNFIIIDKIGRIIRCIRLPAQAALFARHGLFTFCQPGSFFKRQEYQAVGGLNADLNYGMDADLYFRMILNGTRYAYINKYMAGFRVHGMSKTTTEAGKYDQENKLLHHRIWPKMKSNPAWHFFYRAWQVINQNYLRMSIETRLAHNRQWRKWAGTYRRKIVE